MHISISWNEKHTDALDRPKPHFYDGHSIQFLAVASSGYSFRAFGAVKGPDERVRVADKVQRKLVDMYPLSPRLYALRITAMRGRAFAYNARAVFADLAHYVNAALTYKGTWLKFPTAAGYAPDLCKVAPYVSTQNNNTRPTFMLATDWLKYMASKNAPPPSALLYNRTGL